MNKLTMWNPLVDFPASTGRLFRVVDSLFRDGSGDQDVWLPPVDLAETDDAYLLTAELPDVPGEDVKVVVRDGVLTLQGERKREDKKDGTTWHVVERVYGRFSRSFTLPKNADGERVSAEFRNGVLTVTIPKRDDYKPREISVKVA